MHELVTFARRNPLIVVGLAAVAGWAFGSGIVTIPALPAGGPPTTAPAPAPASAVPAAGVVSTNSASMPATASGDALAGWNV